MFFGLPKKFLNRCAAVIVAVSLTPCDGVLAGSFAHQDFFFTERGTPENFARIAIPNSLGKIEEASLKNTSKCIFYIQDAHTSLKAQEQVANLIDYLVRYYDVRTVFEEGHEGTVRTDDYFGWIEDTGLKRQISYYLLDELRIGGAEFAHINRKKDFRLVGIESTDLYLQNLQSYHRAALARNSIEKDLKELESRIRSLAHRIFPQEMKRWLSDKERFSEDKIDLLEYLRRVRSLKKSPLHVRNRSKYPQLSGLFDLGVRPQGGEMRNRNLADFKAFSKELARVEKVMIRRHLTNAAARSAYRYYHLLHLYRKLNSLQLMSVEFESLKRIHKREMTQEIADFLARQSGKTVLVSRAWEKNIQHAFRFYQMAQAREKALEHHIERFIQDPSEKMAILVYGGFHREGILDILRKNKLSYFVAAPKMDQTDALHEKIYHDKMSRDLPGAAGSVFSQAARSLGDLKKMSVNPDFALKFWSDMFFLAQQFGESGGRGRKPQATSRLVKRIMHQRGAASLSRAELRGEPGDPNEWMLLPSAGDPAAFEGSTTNKLRVFTEAIPDAVFRFRLSKEQAQSFSFFSRGAEKLFGISEQEAKTDASAVWSRILPEDFENVKEAIWTSGRTLKPWILEFRLRLPDGSLKWVQSSAIPQDQTDGSIIWNGFMKDVTEKKAAEEKLQKSEERLSLAIDAAQMGTWHWNIQANRIVWNGYSYSLFGMEEGTVAGTLESFMERVYPEDRERVSKAIENSLKKGDYKIEFRIIRANDNAVRWLKTKGKVYRDKDGKPQIMVGVGHDITERKESEIELRKSFAEIKRINEELTRTQHQLVQAEKLAAIGELSAGVAHEVNNPLVSIIGYTQAALDKLQEIERTFPLESTHVMIADLKEVIQASMRIKNIVKDLLDFARPETDHKELIDVRDAVEHAYQMRKRKLEENHIEWIKISDPVIRKVYGNMSQLTQVFLNLIINAEHAIREKENEYHGQASPGGSITVEVKNAADYKVEVKVRDTGKGMDMQTAKKIFDPFFTTRRPQGGTGLGLSVTRTIMSNHKASVEVQSEPGKGTEFRMLLPANRPWTAIDAIVHQALTFQVTFMQAVMHKFNNVVTIVLGNIELALQSGRESVSTQQPIQEVYEWVNQSVVKVKNIMGTLLKAAEKKTAASPLENAAVQSALRYSLREMQDIIRLLTQAEGKLAPLLKKASESDRKLLESIFPSLEHGLFLLKRLYKMTVHDVLNREKPLEWINLKAEITDMVNLFRVTNGAIQQGLVIDLRLEAALDQTQVFVHAEGLRQVLLNLLSYRLNQNAPAEKKLTIEVFTGEGNFILQFKGNYFGSLPDNLSRLSGPADPLAAAYETVKIMGGHFSVRKENEQELLFSIALPIQGRWQPYENRELPQVKGDMVSQRGEDPANKILPGPHAPAPAFAFKKPMIIDDEAPIGMFTAQYLQKILGIPEADIQTLGSGLEAIKRFQSDPSAADLIIIDFSMPRLNGVETARELRRMGVGVPILLYTGYGNAFGAEALEEKLIQGVVSKPASMEEFSEKIKKISDGLQARSELRRVPDELSHEKKLRISFMRFRDVSIRHKFTVFTSWGDLAELTEKQFMEDYEKMAYRNKNLSFVFYGEDETVFVAYRRRIEKMQAELGASRIVVTARPAEAIHQSFARRGRSIHILKASPGVPADEIRKKLAEIPGEMTFRYLKNETGIVPAALLYAESGFPALERGVFDITSFPSLLMGHIRTYQASLIIARAA